ncbi:MAG: hypothetical protein R3F55_12435 [Alphaproteobacteria bacterium]
MVQHLQRRLDLAAQAQRFLVHQHQVRVVDVGGVPDDRFAHVQRLLGVDQLRQRGVFAVAQLDHAGNADEVHPCAEVEAADDRRARQDQHAHVLVALDQRMRDRPAPPEVAEAE